MAAFGWDIGWGGVVWFSLAGISSRGVCLAALGLDIGKGGLFG